YANRPEAFDDDEQELFAELAGDIGHAIHTQEVKDKLEKARQQAEREKRRFQTLFQKAPEEIAIHDTEGEIFEVNQREIENLGYSKEELTSMNVADFQVGYSRDELQKLWDGIAIGETKKAEGKHERKDRSTYPVAVWMNKIEISGDELIIAFVRDITERKEREEEIQELKNRLELAVEGTGLGVWDWDMRTDHVEFTEEWATMLGHSLDEIEPHLQAWEKRVHPDDIDGVEAALNDHIEGKTALYDTEHRMKTADGGWKWIRDIGQVVERDAEGEPLRAVGIHQDIDEKKEREQKLEDQRNKLDILNQILRHDIRNDLQLMTAYADLLEDDLDENLEHVETIQENAKHAIELTTTARDMAEVWLSESDDQSQIPLRSTLEKVLDEARAVHTDSEIQVDGEIPDVQVLADDMLPSIFDNLLKNTIQHNDKNTPAVNVCVEEGAEAVQVRVADNGPGVPDTRKESIFGEGERGMDSRGSGLGLYLVKTLIDKYGGSVWVEDNDPEGAVFAVELQKPAPEER
ncbi:MAG: PAS domain S-box protein, partial [Halobacteriaceae archaeon]